MTAVLLDTHVVHWWSAEPDRLSKSATDTLQAADQLVVAAVSWFELAWLAHNKRISLRIPTRSWLDQLAEEVLTVGISPAIAHTAVSLPKSFPSDPADRLIYATAIERGFPLVTKDRRLRDHRHSPRITVW